MTIFFDLSLFFDVFWKQRFLKILILALYNSSDLPLAAKDRKMNTPANNRKIKLNIFDPDEILSGLMQVLVWVRA